MDRAGERFTNRVLRALDERLGTDAAALGTLVSGAAFEAWLAFETRILLERGDLLRGSRRGLFAENERGKCDLWVGSERDDRRPHWLAEYKLIYNNKNWETAAARVASDLHPTGEHKRTLNPVLGRVAIVALAAKSYAPGFGRNYAECRLEPETWSHEVIRAIERCGAERVFRGAKHSVAHDWLAPGAWLRLYGFAIRRDG